MASPRKSKKMSHTQRKLNLRFVDGVSDVVVEGSHMLSVANHRLYRQGRQYELKVDIDAGGAGGSMSAIEVFALVPTWWLHRAWKMAKANYMKATKLERDALKPIQQAKWDDFRVLPGLTSTSNVAQRNAAGILSDLPTGEYEYSRIENTAGVMKFFTLGSSSATHYNIIEEYSDSFNESQSPTTTITQGPYDDLPNQVKSDQEFQDLQARGDIPPYAQDTLPTHVWVKIAELSQQLGQSNRLSTGWFTAPLGMVRIRSIGGAYLNTNTGTTLEAKAGTYNGVHAPTMG